MILNYLFGAIKAFGGWQEIFLRIKSIARFFTLLRALVIKSANMKECTVSVLLVSDLEEYFLAAINTVVTHLLSCLVGATLLL